MVIPYRETDAWRALALDWVTNRYERLHPDWEVIVGTGARQGPWCKALAAWDALREAEGIVVLSDADVWSDGVELAVEAAKTGHEWAIPHRVVYRLAEEASLAAYDGEDPHVRSLLAQDPYPGVPGGGIVVGPAETFREVPLDPRFKGWGQEDEAHALALYHLYGEPWRGNAPLFHLWHPPAERLTRNRGSREGWELRKRYRHATTPEATRSLLEEARHAGPATHP